MTNDEARDLFVAVLNRHRDGPQWAERVAGDFIGAATGRGMSRHSAQALLDKLMSDAGAGLTRPD